MPAHATSSPAIARRVTTIDLAFIRGRISAPTSADCCLAWPVPSARRALACIVEKGRAIVWTKWVRQPQTLWVRRALFQVHLWTGLAAGLYIVMLSVTGSALVYRNELDRYFATKRPVYDATAKRLTADELRAAAEKAYPGWNITRVGDRITRRNPTIEIWAERQGEKKERLFNP